MGVTKIMFRKNAAALEAYIFSTKQQDDPISFEGCEEGFVAKDFLSHHTFENKEGVNQAIHIIQSWDEWESQSRKPEEFHEMGRKLANRLFPNHDFAICTHTETGKTHNHIILNPVNREDASRVNNKSEWIYKVREVNDELCKEHGLSIVKPGSRTEFDMLPDDVKAIRKRQGFSKVLDLREKIKFASEIATSYDEFGGLLNIFGIDAKVTNKNISYRYPGMQRFKRGDGLGSKFDKKHLEEQFKENDKRFQAISGRSDLVLNEKNYSEHFKFSRKFDAFHIPSKILEQSWLGINSVKANAPKDISDFCSKHGIETFTDQEGVTRIEGREYIRLEGDRWHNEKNKVSGGHIELYMITKRKGYLETLEDLSGEKVFGKIRKEIGDRKATYSGFLMKQPLMRQDSSDESIFEFARREKLNVKALTDLVRSQRAIVFSKGRMKFLAPEGLRGGVSYYRNDKGKWLGRRTGRVRDPFWSMGGPNPKSLIVFDSVYSFLKSDLAHQIAKRPSLDHEVQVLMEPLEAWVKRRKKDGLDFFNVEIVGNKDLRKAKGDYGKVLSIKDFDQQFREIFGQRRDRSVEI